MINILLCGGSGTRLWPLSRKLLPKQFVKLFDDKSLFEKTIDRNRNISNSFLIVSSSEQYFLAKEQVPRDLEKNARYLLEPVAKNTAPALALACMGLEHEDLVFVTPTDHLIKNNDVYEDALTQAKTLAREGYIVTFGIKPSHPETGFGYIESNNSDVLSFKEKPTLKLAEEYVQSGRYYWNSGMLCFKVGSFLSELEDYAPELFNACKKAFEQSMFISERVRTIPIDCMENIPSESVDYALMEKTKKIKMVTTDLQWSDLGSFDSLYAESEKDAMGNAILSRGDDAATVIGINSNNNLIVTQNHAIATIDVDDLVVVDTSDAILISKRGSTQKVKEIVSFLDLKGALHLRDMHTIVYRPWGSYEVLLETPIYKIKRIIVNPDKKLSLQKHYHRSEHWVVVSGTAEVTKGGEIITVRPNESTYIPIGEVHRLENKGKIDLVMIEIQVGEYTGEDDIVRMDDDYGRF